MSKLNKHMKPQKDGDEMQYPMYMTPIDYNPGYQSYGSGFYAPESFSQEKQEAPPVQKPAPMPAPTPAQGFDPNANPYYSPMPQQSKFWS